MRGRDLSFGCRDEKTERQSDPRGGEEDAGADATTKQCQERCLLCTLARPEEGAAASLARVPCRHGRSREGELLVGFSIARQKK